MSNQKTNVIVGAGLNGLVLARLLQKTTTRKIVLLDIAPTAGGLFQSWSYPKYGVYDYGVHVFQDTGVPAIESVIREALPEDDWQVLHGFRREIAGLYFNGRLQTNSAFLDFRDHKDRDALFGGMLKSLNTGFTTASDQMSFNRDISGKFGERILKQIISPIVQGIYGHDVNDLQKLASTLTPFHRVIFCDELVMPDLMKSEGIRGRLGYPEQRNLPPQYASGLASYYPRKFGMQKVIDSLVASFIARGGELHLGASIHPFEGKDQRISTLAFTKSGETSLIENVDRCIWTAALPSLFRNVLGQRQFSIEHDMPPQTWILNLATNQKPEMADLYFYYSYLEGGNAFRISNPLNYSEDHSRVQDGGYPLCIEAVFPAGNQISVVDMKKKLIEELVKMKVIGQDSVIFADLQRLSAGFPMPTLKNARGIAAMRNFIHEEGFKNVIPVGIQSESDLFYYRDVLRYGHQKAVEEYGD